MIGWLVYLLAVLALQIILVCGDNDFAVLYTENLALHKLTNQSSGETSHLAINENYEDFAEMVSGNYKWWTVDLGEEATVRIIKVHNQRTCCDRILENMHMLTSTSSRPGTPNKSNREWTERFSRMQSATKFMLKVFDPMIAARHVAITSENSDKLLTISEVEISGGAETSNVARGKPAKQSISMGSAEGPVANINNGMYDDCSLLGGGWWRVDLLRLYTTHFIRIFKGTLACHEKTFPHIKVLYSMTSSSSPAESSWRQHGGVDILKLSMNMFTEDQVMRHVQVVSQSSAKFSLAEIEVFARLNLALKKPTRQESTYENYVSDLAVNGYLGDFTHTMDAGKKLWTVDLLSIYTVWYIEVINREEFRDRLANVSLYTSKKNNHWLLRDYTEGAYGPAKKVYLDSNREIRHVTIILNRINTPLSLAEVIVKEYNFAFRCETAQTAKYTGTNPQNAVDGSYTTHAGGYYYLSSESQEFWSVKLNKTIQMTSVAIYFKKGHCYFQPLNKWRHCSLEFGLIHSEVFGLIHSAQVFGLIQIKTSKMASPQHVTLDEDVQWSLCHVQDTVPFEQIHLECNRNQRYPPTRHLSIQPHTLLQQVNLREVEIYGKQLPELNSQANVSVISVNATSMTISFPIWHWRNTGTFPPTIYVISLESPLYTQHVQHKQYTNLGSISVTWNGLNPNTTYTNTITCQYEGTTCPGSVVTKNVTTIACTAPGEPQVQWSFAGEGKNRSLNVNLKDVDSNCLRITEYKVTLATETGFVHYNQSTESVQDHIIGGVASDVDYSLSVKVTNNVGMSSSNTTAIFAAAAVPYTPTLTTLAFNSSCVHIGVALQTEQLYHKLQFKFNCTTGLQSQEGTSDEPVSYEAHKVFCGFPKNTLVNCEVQAENGVGGGLILTVKGLTAKQVNTASTNPSAITSNLSDAVTNLELTTAQYPIGMYTLGILAGLIALAMSGIFAAVLIKRRNRIRKVESLQGQKAAHMRE